MTDISKSLTAQPIILLYLFFLRLRLHEEWLERERLAQEEFRLKSEREEAARKRKDDEEVICLRKQGIKAFDCDFIIGSVVTLIMYHKLVID